MLQGIQVAILACRIFTRIMLSLVPPIIRYIEEFGVLIYTEFSTGVKNGPPI